MTPWWKWTPRLIPYQRSSFNIWNKPNQTQTPKVTLYSTFFFLFFPFFFFNQLKLQIMTIKLGTTNHLPSAIGVVRATAAGAASSFKELTPSPTSTPAIGPPPGPCSPGSTVGAVHNSLEFSAAGIDFSEPHPFSTWNRKSLNKSGTKTSQQASINSILAKQYSDSTHPQQPFDAWVTMAYPQRTKIFCYCYQREIHFFSLKPWLSPGFSSLFFPPFVFLFFFPFDFLSV